MQIAPEATCQHTQVVPPEGALARDWCTSVSKAVSVNTNVAGPPQNPRLLDRVHALIRTKHYSIRTERIYASWIRDFIRFHGKRHRSTWAKRKSRRFSPTSRMPNTSRRRTRTKPWQPTCFSTGRFWESNSLGSIASCALNARSVFPRSSPGRRWIVCSLAWTARRDCSFVRCTAPACGSGVREAAGDGNR